MKKLEQVQVTAYKCNYCLHLVPQEDINVSQWVFKGIYTFWCPYCGSQLFLKPEDVKEVVAKKAGLVEFKQID